MKQPVLMRHKNGWLEGELQQSGNIAIIRNPNGNELYRGSADFLDKQFANGNIKIDEGREATLFKLFGDPS